MDNFKKEKAPILYIDDEIGNLTVFNFSLRKHYKIYTAQSAAEGLEILKQNNNIKIVLSDQRMPETTGIEFFENTQSLFPDIVRIIVTGYSKMDTIENGINNGLIYTWISKPWKKERLTDIINKALELVDNKQN